MSLESNHPAVAPTAPLEKEEMSNQEASWHSHVAGQRATAEAKAQGGDPAAMDTLAGAAAGPEIISGQTLQPCTQGTILAMQLAGELFEPLILKEGLSEEEADLTQTGLAAIIFRDALPAYREMKANGLTNIYPEAQAIVWEMDVEKSIVLTRHVRKQIDLFNRLNAGEEATPEPGKPAGPGASSSTENLPVETPSPALTGSCQTTGSASEKPSGTSPLPQPSPSSPPVTNDAVETRDRTTRPALVSEPGTAPGHG